MQAPSVLLSITLGAGLACSAPERPTGDVILIVVDTLRADALGDHTPHIAALAHDGVSFERAFAHAPITLPAHTALFSGKLPRTTGVLNNGQGVPQSLPLLTDILAERGYRTRAAVSLATLWPVEHERGLDQGFDRFARGEREILSGAEVNTTLLEELDGEPAGLFLFCHYSDPHHPYNAQGTDRLPVEVTLDGTSVTELNAAELCYFDEEISVPPGVHQLRLKAARPFRLNRAKVRFELAATTHVEYSTNETGPTHDIAINVTNPTDATQQGALSLWLHADLSEQEIRERYALEVQAVDRAVGALLEQLKRSGRYASSLIVFTSDHGEGLGEHGSIGHVRNLYDEVLHVPLIIKLPEGHPQAGALADAAHTLARHVDILPTLGALLDLEVPPGLEGTSLLNDGPRVLRAETHPPQAPKTLFALRDEEYKLVFEPAGQSFELYDLSVDPGEERNVFAEAQHVRPAWVHELRGSVARQATPGAAVEANLKALGYR